LSSEKCKVEFNLQIFLKYLNLTVALGVVHWFYHLSSAKFPWRYSS